MVKKTSQQVLEESEDENQSFEEYGSESGEEEVEQEMSEEVPQQRQAPEKNNFGLKEINNEERLLERLDEVQKNFYNRLASASLIKKQGRVPFTEHMTCAADSTKEVVIP